MGCQQACQRQINIIEEDYSESEFSETSQSKNDFEIHRLKNISFSKQKGKRDNSSLLEIIKQRENNKNKVSVLTLQKEPQKAENQEVSFINVCCTKPNQQSKLIENLSFSIASQLQQSERKNKNDTQMSIDRKREDNDQNNQQSLLKIVNQNSAINDSSKGAIMSLEKSLIKSRKDQQAIKSTIVNKINNKTSFDVLMNQDFSILPNKKRQTIPRKITSPIFFTQLQQFNVFQNIKDADEDLKRRGSNLQPMKVANLIQQNQQNSKEILNSNSSSSFSSNFQDEQLENRRISTNLKAHPKSKFASLKKNCIMDDNKSDQDKEPQQNESEVDDDEEEEEEDHMKILYKSNTIQIEQKPEDRLLMLDETIQDLLMNKIKNQVDQISNLQLPKDISAERQQDNQNGTDKQNSGQ